MSEASFFFSTNLIMVMRFQTFLYNYHVLFHLLYISSSNSSESSFFCEDIHGGFNQIKLVTYESKLHFFKPICLISLSRGYDLCQTLPGTFSETKGFFFF